MIKIKLLLLFFLGALSVNAQKTDLGTEIWIEPGYSITQITDWVKQSADAGFKDVRIFMMWTHVEPRLNEWNFDVYDWMFETCEKYHLRLQVTLNPNQPAFHYGKEYWGSIHSHSIFSDPEMQEASVWMPFLNTFGLSIHPTWHFNMFTPDQYTMGVAATCELGRSVANPKPFWISELSGGNNLFHYCPSSNEIAMWTWTGIAEGAQKIIYWLLNARTSGNESGEWAMLDFQNEPSGRLKVAAEIAYCLNTDSSFFNNAKPLESDITILLSPESSITCERKGQGDMHTQAAMACYEALAERGVSAKLEQTQDFNWAQSTGKAIILAIMITIPDILEDSIKVFLSKGNKMIVLGPSGYYNEKEDCRFLNFPFKNEFGAEPKEIQTLADRFQISSLDGKYEFEANKIFGTIRNYSAKPICEENGNTCGIRNKTENSEVVWIPSSIDLGAWKYGNNAFSQFLADELVKYSTPQPFSFVDKTNKVGMQTMNNGNTYLTVITNGLKTDNRVHLVNRQNKNATIAYCTNDSRKEINIKEEIQLKPEECLVLIWKNQ